MPVIAAPLAAVITSPRATPARAAGLSVLDRAHQEAFDLVQPERVAQPPRLARAGQRDAQRGRRGRAAGGELSARSRSALAGQATIRPSPARIAFRPRIAPVGVDERAAAGAAGERRGVLQRALDQPAARAADRARGRRQRSGRHPQAAARRVGEREHGVADPQRAGVRPRDRGEGGIDAQAPQGPRCGRRRAARPRRPRARPWSRCRARCATASRRRPGRRRRPNLHAGRR